VGLTGQEYWQLQQALISAYPSQAMLKQMIRFSFDVGLEEVAGGANYSEIVFNLIEWSESEGKTAELIAKAVQQKPGNEDLKAFADAYEKSRQARPPEEIDLSAWVTVHDSGAEGTVAGIAVASAMEISLGRQGKPGLVSARFLYEKAKKHDEAGLSEGTFLTSVLYVAEQFGAPPEDAWPYRAGDRGLPAGKTWDQLEAAAIYRARSFRLGSYDDIPGELSKGRPVVAGVKVFQETWMSADSAGTGRIDPPAPDATLIGGHAIAIIGAKPSDGSIRFANSWGTGWGDGGFGSMSKESLEAHLESDQVWAVEAT
jgi:Effector-associated domain 1/Papain family cysteine protease